METKRERGAEDLRISADAEFAFMILCRLHRDRTSSQGTRSECAAGAHFKFTLPAPSSFRAGTKNDLR